MLYFVQKEENPMNKETKKLIRQLRKLKRQCQVGTQQRRDINRQIREIKEKEIIPIDNEKQKLILEIQQKQPDFKSLGIDLSKYTVEQLQKHLARVK